MNKKELMGVWLKKISKLLLTSLKAAVLFMGFLFFFALLLDGFYSTAGDTSLKTPFKQIWTCVVIVSIIYALNSYVQLLVDRRIKQIQAKK